MSKEDWVNKCDHPICPDCLADWQRCFPDPLTEVNNLSTMQAELDF